MSHLTLACSIHPTERRADGHQPGSGLPGMARTARIWAERCRQRTALADLDDRLLDDVGLSREEARREIAKPFWER